jgi:hypothetical protein
MKLRGKTKLIQNKKSLTSTIPIAIVQMMNFKKGDTIVWELDIKDNKPFITVYPDTE